MKGVTGVIAGGAAVDVGDWRRVQQLLAVGLMPHQREDQAAPVARSVRGTRRPVLAMTGMVQTEVYG